MLTCKKTDGFDSSLVVATSCPMSGWETVAPLLARMGLEPAGDGFARWLDELVPSGGLPDPRSVAEPLRPDQHSMELLANLLREFSSETLLLADGRHLRLLDFWAETFPRSKFLLFYTSSEYALAEAYIRGYDPGQLLAAWKAAGARLLEFRRRRRQRSLLFDARAVMRHPDGLAPVCERIGLSLQRPGGAPPPLDPPPLESLLAKFRLSSQSEARLLETELEASAHPLGEPAADGGALTERPAGDFNRRPVTAGDGPGMQVQGQIQPARSDRSEHDVLALELTAERLAGLEQEQRNFRKLKDGHAESRRLNELYLLQLQQIKEELGAEFLQKQRLEKDAVQLKAQLEQLRRGLEEKEAESISRRDEIAGLREAVRERDSKMTALSDENRSRLEEFQKDRQQQEADMEKAGRENELLLLQLSQVQEELETVLLEKRRLEKDAVQLKAQLEQLMQGLKEKEAESISRRDEITGLREAVRERDSKLAALSEEKRSRLEELQRARQELAADREKAAQENELLLLQLRQVQEERETIFLEKRRLEEEKIRREKELKAEMESSRRAFLAKENELAELKTRLDGIMGSRSWKITAPLRAAAGPFRRHHAPEPPAGIRDQIAMIRESGCFDEKWYLAQYPDVGKTGADPVEHYLLIGAGEGCNPSPGFNTLNYLRRNPDVVKAGINPLLHYVEFGRAEGRNPGL
ncbi:MAG: hypothetical protein JW793_04320 [Acidobacteria bacterium]|nr:hypothetical protein [Acidobacteriota bacterium]